MTGLIIIHAFHVVSYKLLQLTTCEMNFRVQAVSQFCPNFQCEMRSSVRNYGIWYSSVSCLESHESTGDLVSFGIAHWDQLDPFGE